MKNFSWIYRGYNWDASQRKAQFTHRDAQFPTRGNVQEDEGLA